MNKISKLTASIAVGISLISEATLANAQDYSERKEMRKKYRQEHQELRNKHKTEAMFERVDQNEDGQIDLSEYLTHSEERFKNLDQNSDGVVTKEEAQTAMASIRKHFKKKHKEKINNTKDSAGEN